MPLATAWSFVVSPSAPFALFLWPVVHLHAVVCMWSTSICKEQIRGYVIFCSSSREEGVKVRHSTEMRCCQWADSELIKQRMIFSEDKKAQFFHFCALSLWLEVTFEKPDCKSKQSTQQAEQTGEFIPPLECRCLMNIKSNDLKCEQVFHVNWSTPAERDFYYRGVTGSHFIDRSALPTSHLIFIASFQLLWVAWNVYCRVFIHFLR